MQPEIFGCWAAPGDVAPALLMDGCYYVVAKCPAGCHFMTHLIDGKYMDSWRYPDAYWDTLYERIQIAFRKVHP